MVLNPSAVLPLNLEITYYVALRKKDKNQKLKKNMPKRLCIELLLLLLLFQCFFYSGRIIATILLKTKTDKMYPNEMHEMCIHNLFITMRSLVNNSPHVKNVKTCPKGNVLTAAVAIKHDPCNVFYVGR
jgi:hypothetical protein